MPIRRHYTVRRSTTRLHPGIVQWAIVLDGEREPLSVAGSCPEALAMASRLARSDWTVRGMPSAVLLADDEGGLSTFEVHGQFPDPAVA